MKKIILFITILLFIIFFTGCKDPVIDFQWNSLVGEGSFSSSSNQSYIKFTGSIKLNQSTVNINPSNPQDPSHFQQASINFWECLLADGESGVLLFNGENINDLLGNIYTNISDDGQVEYLWVFAESKVLIDRDIYSGKSPDRIIMKFYILGSDGSITTMEKEADFAFTRE